MSIQYDREAIDLLIANVIVVDLEQERDQPDHRSVRIWNDTVVPLVGALQSALARLDALEARIETTPPERPGQEDRPAAIGATVRSASERLAIRKTAFGHALAIVDRDKEDIPNTRRYRWRYRWRYVCRCGAVGSWRDDTLTARGDHVNHADRIMSNALAAIELDRSRS